MDGGELFSRIQDRGDQAFTERGTAVKCCLLYVYSHFLDRLLAFAGFNLLFNFIHTLEFQVNNFKSSGSNGFDVQAKLNEDLKSSWSQSQAGCFAVINPLCGSLFFFWGAGLFSVCCHCEWFTFEHCPVESEAGQSGHCCIALCCGCLFLFQSLT